MPVFDLKAYRRAPLAQWELAEQLDIESPSLRGAISKLSRKLKVKFKGKITQDGQICWTLHEPPDLATLYLEIYPLNSTKPQRMKVLALDELDAAKQLRARTGRRIIHSGFNESLQAHTFECKGYKVFVYRNDPTEEQP